MHGTISDVERRINRYWYSDGLGEMIGGSMFLILAIYFALQDFLGRNSMLSGMLQAGLAILLIGGAFVSRRLINALKARLTYPRTGYVEYRVNQKQLRMRQLWAFVVACTVAALAVAFVGIFKSYHSMVAVTGFIVGMILVVLRAKSSGLMRFYVLGAVSLILGLAISVRGWSDGYSLGLYYGLMGVCFLVSGGLTLKHYLDENPLPAEDKSES